MVISEELQASDCPMSEQGRPARDPQSSGRSNARQSIGIMLPSPVGHDAWICIVLRYISLKRDNLSARISVYFYWMARSIG